MLFEHFPNTFDRPFLVPCRRGRDEERRIEEREDRRGESSKEIRVESRWLSGYLILTAASRRASLCHPNAS